MVVEQGESVMSSLKTTSVCVCGGEETGLQEEWVQPLHHPQLRKLNPMTWNQSTNCFKHKTHPPYQRKIPWRASAPPIPYRPQSPFTSHLQLPDCQLASPPPNPSRPQQARSHISIEHAPSKHQRRAQLAAWKLAP